MRRTERGRVKALERHRTNSSREEDNFSSPVNSRGKCMESGRVKSLERHRTNSSREEDNFSSPVNSRGK